MNQFVAYKLKLNKKTLSHGSWIITVHLSTTQKNHLFN